MAAIIISEINNKGGVGKTTSTALKAELLAFLGKKVLLVDMDEQGNLSMMFNCLVEDNEQVIEGIETPEENNIAELITHRFRDKESVLSTIKHTPINGIDIIPSSKRHKNTVLKIINSTGNNNIILKRALDTVKEDYDYILIDNAPASNILTVNSMFASDYIVVPVRMEGFSYKGLKETLASIAYIKEEHAITNAKFLGTFMTQTENNTVIFKDLNEEYFEQLSGKYFKTPIRKDVKVYEIETFFKPILEYCPNTNVVFDYANLLLEMKILDPVATEQLKKAIGID